ncbi:MAG: TetR/AcrR family transcriptional regulator [Chitinophagaceae bacterium]|nr:MAG: TetR/AcrR family transcriptional regulator [Chitinophagaceae bacterium]
MPRQKVSREFILHQSLKIFRQKSFYNTTTSDIAAACGLQKGSLYHYFPSKEAIMIEVINYVHDFFSKEIFVHAYNEKLGAKQRLEYIIDLTEDIFIGPDGGDVMGNIGVETARVVPEFAAPIRSFFIDWKNALSFIFKSEYDEEIAAEYAEQSVAEIEGSILMMRIFNDPEILKRTHTRVLKKLKK